MLSLTTSSLLWKGLPLFQDYASAYFHLNLVGLAVRSLLQRKSRSERYRPRYNLLLSKLTNMTSLSAFLLL